MSTVREMVTYITCETWRLGGVVVIGTDCCFDMKHWHLYFILVVTVIILHTMFLFHQVVSFDTDVSVVMLCC